MRKNRLALIFKTIFLSGILAIGGSAVQAQMVDIDKNSFDIQGNPLYPISNVHVINDYDELLLKGSVNYRFGKTSLRSGHVDITFTTNDGVVIKKECVYFGGHHSKRSCERHATFELHITEDLLNNSKIKIQYIPKKQ